MSIPKIRKALETRLSAITPSIPTAFENGNYTPTPGTPYQRCYLLPNTPDDAQYGRTHLEVGIFQVTVCYPMGAGPGAAEARAQVIKDAFKRGTSMVESGVTVTVTNAPSVSSGVVDGDRYCIPVSLRYQAQVTS